MNAKDYLKQVQIIDKQIDIKLERVSRLRAMTQKATSAVSEEAVARSRNNTSLQDAILRLMEEEKALNKEIDRSVDLKREISSLLDSLPDLRFRLLLEMRYLCFKSWEDIAVDLGLNVRTVFRLHARALREMEDLLRLKKILPEPVDVSKCHLRSCHSL